MKRALRLYVLRHGIAIDREDPACPPDPERPLTARGVERTQEAMAGLRALGVKPERVLTSPYLRASQTARIAAIALRRPVRSIVETKALLPDRQPDELLAQVRRGRARAVLCVGHAPQLDLLIGEALGYSGSCPTTLKKAGVACLDLEGSAAGRLVWLLEPLALRRLARAGAARR